MASLLHRIETYDGSAVEIRAAIDFAETYSAAVAAQDAADSTPRVDHRLESIAKLAWKDVDIAYQRWLAIR